MSPKNMITSRARLVHKARNAHFGNSSHPAGGRGVREGGPGPREKEVRSHEH